MKSKPTVHQPNDGLAARQVAEQVVAEGVAAVQQKHPIGAVERTRLCHGGGQRGEATHPAAALELFVLAAGVAGLRSRIAGRHLKRKVPTVRVVDVQQRDAACTGQRRLPAAGECQRGSPASQQPSPRRSGGRVARGKGRHGRTG